MPPLALLAGGLATRMRPLTEKIPKSLLEVAGEPFIAHQLRLFHDKGIRQVVICAGFLGQMIEDFVGDGSRFGLSVGYSFDGEQLLGTGGALKKAKAQLAGEFLVVYGDSWLDGGYGEIVEAFRGSGKRALMAVFRNKNSWDMSNIEFENGIIRNYDKRNQTLKMDFIDWGLGIVGPDVFDEWQQTERFDLADVYACLVGRDEMAGYEVEQRFYEIGSMSGLDETNQLLADAIKARSR